MEAKQLQQQLEVLSNTSMSVAASINAAVQQEGQLQEKVGVVVQSLKGCCTLQRMAQLLLADEQSSDAMQTATHTTRHTTRIAA